MVGSRYRKHNKLLIKIYNKLYTHFGSRRWWPADTPFEVMIGAVLTQNTAWTNVEKAIANLKKAGVLSPKKIKGISKNRLERLIRPSGFYKEKAKKLKVFVEFLIKKRGNPSREELLSVNGVGPETADSILLYAFNKPTFVVDAYTKRIFARHGLIPAGAAYDDVRDFFMRNLPKDAKLFNEYHALIVEAGKNFCKKNNPRCKICPLYGILNKK